MDCKHKDDEAANTVNILEYDSQKENTKANESNRKNSSHKEMVANRVPKHQIKGFTFLLEVRLITPCSQLLDPGVVGVGELFVIGLGIIWRLDPTIRGS